MTSRSLEELIGLICRLFWDSEYLIAPEGQTSMHLLHKVQRDSSTTAVSFVREIAPVGQEDTQSPQISHFFKSITIVILNLLFNFTTLVDLSQFYVTI